MRESSLRALSFFRWNAEPAKFHPVGKGGLDVCRALIFRDGAAFKARVECFAESFALLERRENLEVFAGEALVVDRIFVAVDGEEDVFALEKYYKSL